MESAHHPPPPLPREQDADEDADRDEDVGAGVRRVRDEQLAAELDPAAVLVPRNEHVHAQREHE